MYEVGSVALPQGVQGRRLVEVAEAGEVLAPIELAGVGLHTGLVCGGV